MIEQGLIILKAHENIRCIFTTPKLLEALCEKISLPKYGITGIFCGGTEMNAAIPPIRAGRTWFQESILFQLMEIL